MSIAARLLGVSGTRDTLPDTVTRAPVAATGTTGWSSPGMPQTPRWDATNAVSLGYYGHIYAYRCARSIATTIAGLPFRAGLNADRPGAFDINAPLARLLGPPPGGPAPNVSPRRMWAWSIVNYLICGRYGWETPADPRTGRVTALWPLVAGRLKPIPTLAGTDWFSGFEYQLNANIRRLRPDQVFYAWRPSQDDWREPESVLQAAALPLSTAIALDKHMYAFMRNNMVGSKLVVTAGFEDNNMRRAFQDQFLEEMTGYDNAGRTAFAEYDDTVGDGKVPSVQVVDLGTKPVDAQTIEQVRELKRDICVAFGVPVSMLGDASDRTYENADQEHRNYWTGTILPLLHEITDDINMTLAPRVGSEVGWFDISQVAALRPQRLFQDTDPIELEKAGFIAKSEWRLDAHLSASPPADIRPDTPTSFDEASDVVDTARGDDLTTKVHAYLARNYPERVLGWVDDATWRLDPAVPLSRIKMARRPGARDQDKVEGIADAVKAGKSMEPVVLVDTGEEQLEIADGYHRTAAFERAGRKTIAAYVATGVGRHGPWEQDMHEAKLNRAVDQMLARAIAEMDIDSGDRYDVTPLGEGKNWVTKVGGLPLFARAIAHALIRNGHTESQAIQLALGIIENWASGRGNVTAKTRAKAVAAWAEWQRKKAQTHATPNKRDALLESSSAGALIPTGSGAVHLPIRGPVRGKCGLCGQPASAKTHRYGRSPRRRPLVRHAGAGHESTPTGHATRRRRLTAAAVSRHADTLEPVMAKALTDLFADQERATLDRLTGKRGKQMLRAATGDSGDGEDPSGTTPIVDAAQVYDMSHWRQRTRSALEPVYAAIGTLTAERLGSQFGDEATQSTFGAVRQVLEDRLDRLAELLTRSTFDQIADALRDGVINQRPLADLAAALRRVFQDPSRAATVARTEVIGALNQTSHTYAEQAGPQLVAGREWLAAHDARVRHTHAEADGQVRRMGEPYMVGGVPMMFPGDPAAPPGEVINCRCTQAFLTPGQYAKAIAAPAHVAA